MGHKATEDFIKDLIGPSPTDEPRIEVFSELWTNQPSKTLTAKSSGIWRVMTSLKVTPRYR